VPEPAGSKDVAYGDFDFELIEAWSGATDNRTDPRAACLLFGYGRLRCQFAKHAADSLSELKSQSTKYAAASYWSCVSDVTTGLLG
jgi:hypothetical protein